MIACDTNILFVALETSRPHHEEARGFLTQNKENPDFALCELSLLELYVLLRNPVVSHKPLQPREAVSIIQRLRKNPHWDVLDYPGSSAGIMEQIWKLASNPSFPRRRVFDARLALTLRHHGVDEFATSNEKDFKGFGFKRVWNPLKAR